jgi:hypothetical protein
MKAGVGRTRLKASLPESLYNGRYYITIGLRIAEENLHRISLLRAFI